MDTGNDFVQAQVANAVMQHRTFLQSLEDHEGQAEDPRFRDLCSRHIPRMREHQRMLEEVARSFGADDEGMAKKIAGAAMGVAKDLADAARKSDFLRLVGDIVMARQSEDTFKTFRDSGRQLGLAQLAQVGEVGERHHDDYVKEANRLVQQLFVELARGTEQAASAENRPSL
jgi:ferritin-like metal-binding protein YciE